MQKMKHLMGYKSQETLGTVKGKSRLDENVKFTDIWNKTKQLMEMEDIEGADAKEGNWDEINVPQSADAKKHVEGSVSTEKGTKAPKPKTGEFEKIKKNAPEATKHVTMKESVEEEEEIVKEVEGEDDKPKAPSHEETDANQVTEADNIEGVKAASGEWEKIKVPHAAEAKKHIHMGKESTAKQETVAKENKDGLSEGVVLGGIRFEPINEGMYEEGVYEEGTEGYANDNGDEESDIVDAYYNTLVGNNYDNEGQFYAHCDNETDVVEMILSRLSKVDFNRRAIAATIVYAIKYFKSGERIHHEEEIENDEF